MSTPRAPPTNPRRGIEMSTQPTGDTMRERRKDSPAVIIDNVAKHFGEVQALRGFSAEIRYGRLTGLVGPDGAGKTTLMRIMTGLLVPDGGSVTLAGLDVVKDNDAIHVVSGYMPQRFGLYEDLSVMENMRLYAQLRGMHADRHADLFESLLDFTRLGPFTQRLAGKLSGGMKQKLGLACALMARPRVLLLDEPGVGVDPVSRQDLWRMVQALTDEGMAVVWSTAYLDEAERCESVLLLNQGQLLFDGPPQDLTAQLEGRSFRLEDVGAERRAVLTEALDLPSVSDGVIQGAGVRVVLRAGAGAHALRGRLHRPARGRPWRHLGPGRAPAAGRTGFRHRRVLPQSHQALRCLHRDRQRQLRGAQGRNLRPARSQRRREIHHLQDALRPAETHRGRGACGGARPAPRHRRGQEPAGLHGAEVLALRPAVGAAEPGIFGRRLRTGRQHPARAHRGNDRHLRSER